METIQIETNVVVVNNEPDFVADTHENVSANFVILCEDNMTSLPKNIYENKAHGVSLLNWVARACLNQPMVLRMATDDIVTLIKPYAKGADYTVVLFANTPLVNKQHLMDLIAFVDRRHIHACKLKCGYIFKTEYLQRIDEIYSIDTYDFEGDDFFEVNTLNDLAYAQEVLGKRILAFHRNNGVLFESEASVFVDAGANLGYGTTVKSGVSVLGKTSVGTDCKLGANVVIEGSKVADSVQIEHGAIVENSVVKVGAKIGAGAVIKNSVIGQNVIVELGVTLSDSAVKNNSVVGEKCYIKNSEVKENTFIGDAVTLVSARIAENVKIGSGAVVVGDEDPAIVTAGVEILSGSVVNTVFDAAVSENQEAGE